MKEEAVDNVPDSTTPTPTRSVKKESSIFPFSGDAFHFLCDILLKDVCIWGRVPKYRLLAV